jgi:hypothetical protein
VEEAAPGIVFEDLRFRSYRGEELEATGQARRASLRRSSGEVSAESIDLRFPARGGAPAQRVEAVRGEGNLRKRETKLQDAVVTRGGGGE